MTAGKQQLPCCGSQVLTDKAPDRLDFFVDSEVKFWNEIPVMPTVQVRAQRVKAAKAERRSIQSKLQSLKAQIAEARPEVDKLAGARFCRALYTGFAPCSLLNNSSEARTRSTLLHCRTTHETAGLYLVNTVESHPLLATLSIRNFYSCIKGVSWEVFGSAVNASIVQACVSCLLLCARPT